ncbi:MAG: cob(I)yrinic acid a,c-diamide adenosyltransferase [Betaproteobacteria bacterium]
MANRLTKITTRTGDDGTTGLGDGSRVHKGALRIQVMGDIDELNSVLGVLLAESLPPVTRERLMRIQNHLFDLGGETCIPGHRVMSDVHVTFLDEASGELNADLRPLKEFILPGGARAAAICHVARTIARRAERSMATLAAGETVSASALKYLNRLSDYLFIQARALNRDAGVADVLWQRDPEPARTKGKAAT